jgi:hypothetical protein
MVDARLAIGRRRAFVKNKRRATLSGVNTFLENIVLLPVFVYFRSNVCEAKLFVFRIFLFHKAKIV